jgi:hypothetical protein
MLTIEIKDDIGDCNVVNQHFHATILVNRWGRNGVQERPKPCFNRMEGVPLLLDLRREVRAEELEVML